MMNIQWKMAEIFDNNDLAKIVKHYLVSIEIEKEEVEADPS